MQNELESALGRAVRFLQEYKIRYALIGGIAVSQWGFDRFTGDVDFRVLVPETGYGEVRSALRREFPNRARELLPENSPVVAVKIDDVIVDFALCYPGYDELLVERAIPRKIGEVDVFVATAEDIIILKAIADRAQDWQDIEGIIGAQHEVMDFSYVESWLPQFAEALEKPEMLEKYREVKAQVDRNRSR